MMYAPPKIKGQLQSLAHRSLPPPNICKVLYAVDITRPFMYGDRARYYDLLY